MKKSDGSQVTTETLEKIQLYGNSRERENALFQCQRVLRIISAVNNSSYEFEKKIR